MSSRDFRHREPKKQKREAKKAVRVSVIPPEAIVEVLPKGRKTKEAAGE